jgi:imidazolonepropionase-like amidohydrolase
VLPNRFEVDGADISVRLAGDREQPALLPIHGFPGSSTSFWNVTGTLARDWFVIVPDFPRRACSVLAILLASIASTLGAQQSATDPGTAPFIAIPAGLVAVTHVQLIDGSGSPAKLDHTVILRGDRIEAVGPSADIAVPAGARVLDLRGHSVLPGLVGLHEHTYFGGVGGFTDMRVSAPLLYLALGVTTAMTAGSRSPAFELELKRRVDRGDIPGPRFHVSGPYLDIAAGGPVNRVAVTTPAEARRVVAEWAERGATWFKFLGGASRAVMGAAVEEAHGRGLKVTGHLCSVTFTEAAALGMDALQHGFITNSDYVRGKRPDECPPGNMQVQADVDLASGPVRESIRKIVAAGSAVVSTLGVYETFDPERARLDPGAMAMLAPATRREVEENHARVAARGFTVPTRLLKKMMEWERMFVAAGGLLGAGSDPWGTGYLPGFGNLRNYQLLVEAGFTAEQAVQIMTLNGARILGVDRELGSIVPGKLADLVVVQGDPVRVPEAIHRVVTIFKGGAGYDSGHLRAAARGKVGVE